MYFVNRYRTLGKPITNLCFSKTTSLNQQSCEPDVTVFVAGSMLSKPYQQFAGTVQVMKAVQSHIVLTFCSPNQSHYSIILARFNHLSLTDIRGVRNLLGRRGLPQVGIRETCKDSAALAAPTLLLLVVLSLTSLYSSSTSV